MPTRSAIAIILTLALAGALSIGAAGPVRAQDDAEPTPGPERGVRYALLRLGETGREMVGLHITDDAIRDALALIPETRAPDLLILRINSPGGMLREVPDLVDLITEELAPGTRVVAWIDLASSAAAMVAMACPEIAMRPGATIGAAVAYKIEGGRPVSLEGEELERSLEVGREISRRSGRDPRILRAMQTPTPLSYDPAEGGAPAALRSDTDGREVLNDGTTILTLASIEAHEIGVSIGAASSIEELLTLLGVDASSAVDVGGLASAQLHRRLLKASAAKDRMIAYRASVRRAIRGAREATTDAERVAQLERADRPLGRLRREAAAWPDVAAYLGVDAFAIEDFEAQLAELHEPVGASE